MDGAHLLPPWLELKQEICGDIERVLAGAQYGPAQDADLHAINQKIGRYNQQCPSPLLQRQRLSWETLASEAAEWR